jgi:UDP-N-acetylmuramoyl-tripeptide--D-alanyl-D-alanine ligase
MDYSLFDVAAALNQPAPPMNQSVHRVVIDSRVVVPGDVFVAIKGARFDGYEFVAQAIDQGAIAVVTDRPVNARVTVFQVADSRAALGALAKAYHAQCQCITVAITGSCGKTSTTALTASVLSQRGQTLATEGTLNNEIGVPLTLFRLTKQDRYAVIEMGANHAKEIAYLSSLAPPNIAVITNSGPVHLEGFGSVFGVQCAKGELYENLAPNAVAIINADDSGALYWRSLLSHHRILEFSTLKPADVYARHITLNESLQPCFDLVVNHSLYDAGEAVTSAEAPLFVSVQLPVAGAHQVANALAAAAVGIAAGLSLAEIKCGLEAAPKVAQRGIMRKGYQDLLILDDSYNANPKAFCAAIDMLMAVPNQHKRIVVMGDMAELGALDVAYAAHESVGQYAKENGVDAFYSVGKLSEAASKSFGAAGYHFSDQKNLIAALKNIAQAGICVLIKGSKSSQMGCVVAELM